MRWSFMLLNAMGNDQRKASDDLSNWIDWPRRFCSRCNEVSLALRPNSSTDRHQKQMTLRVHVGIW